MVNIGIFILYHFFANDVQQASCVGKSTSSLSDNASPEAIVVFRISKPVFDLTHTAPLATAENGFMRSNLPKCYANISLIPHCLI